MFKFIILAQVAVFFVIISSTEAGYFDGLVNVDRQENGDRKVGVHVPFFYWMDLNRNKQGPKLDLSVLGGLVKVNVDRNKPQGKRPVMVRLLGQKIYNSYPSDYQPTNSLFGNFANYQNQGEESKNVEAIKPTENYESEKAQESNAVTTESY